jgi:dTDP-3-amino-2,3,6-trideoxy-4-keto-D-glucose/dTDP-3-amino-3,4,6-trideoxy-alpha-D-glucose/dTDP-2,6-dideoxy-D-kanosamine transaminase
MIQAPMRVPFSYLDRQFADVDAYLDEVKALVRSGDFTLGKPVGEFERRFAAMCGLPHAVGVGSGTDALILSLEILGIGPGDEVITAANTFVATAGAIAMTRATPVFVDNDDGYVIDPDLIEAKITPRTRAIVPVHYSGNVCNMPRIMQIARKHGLAVVEDACQSIAARFDDLPVGTWGDTAAFSLHPLKNLNVWGDGGVIVTRRADLDATLRLYRNHGLAGRDEVLMWGHNSRLDSLHAVIGNRLIAETVFITAQRIANARQYDAAFAAVPEIRVPHRDPRVKHTYHLYMLRVERRDELMTYLNERGVEAKVHYPIPLHLQPAAASLGYRPGDFPMAEADAQRMITLPAHQHLSAAEIAYTIEAVRAFYRA